MYRVVEMRGDNEPWWFFENWRDDIVAKYEFDNFYDALKVYKQEWQRLAHDYPEFKSQEDFLSDDVSIMIARNKKTKEHIRIVNLLKYTNENVLPFSEDIPAEIITFLDPTIEKLHFDENDSKTLIHLKFRGKEDILLNSPVELNSYLSSGTVKGMITFTLAREVLQSGGYIVVDEVENHFNKEIVTTLLRFFMDNKLNKNGGILIFSTHYPELLDEYERNDGIFITRNRNGITAENLSKILKRNDIKKSDAYQSGFLEGTTPTYEAYMQLKKSIALTLV